jgi:hypothetical protein
MVMTDPQITLRLVLTHHWFDETASGRKVTEYRAMTDWWRRLIWDRREQIHAVRFDRGYSKRKITRKVTRIDIGPCPIPGWSGNFYRVHFTLSAS